MRKSKVVKIDRREITIKELRVKDVYDLVNDNSAGMLGMVDLVLERCTDIDRSSLLDMTPSDLKELVNGFTEVNEAFLDLAAMIGLDDLPAVIRSNLRSQFALSSQPDME